MRPMGRKSQNLILAVQKVGRRKTRKVSWGGKLSVPISEDLVAPLVSGFGVAGLFAFRSPCVSVWLKRANKGSHCSKRGQRTFASKV